MRLRVRLMGAGEGALDQRLAELQRRLRESEQPAVPIAAQSEDENDGKRELGVAAGDLRQPDE